MSANTAKSKQAKAAPMEAELITTEAGTQDYSHLPLNEQAAMRCKARIEGALKGATVAYYDMAFGLLEAYENDYAKIWGYDNFADYVEKSLDMRYRSAYYMVEIGKVARTYEIDRVLIERIGWTKMKEIASFITANPDKKQQYLDMAESMSTSQLKEALGSEVRMTEGSGAKPAIMRLSMKLEGDAANMVNDGLALACGDIGKEDVSLAFQHIVGEWLVARGSSPTATSLEDWTAYLEKTYGVKLVRAEAADSIDALLSGREATSASEDAALEDLLNATEDDLDELLKS